MTVHNFVLAIGAVAVGIAGTFAVAPTVKAYFKERAENPAAHQAATFAREVDTFINQNFTAIRDSLAGNANRVYTAADLQSLGVLGGGFQAQNRFGQSHAVIVYRPIDPVTGTAANRLKAWATTCGGQQVPDGTLLRFITLMEPNGAAVLATEPANIVGAGRQDIEPITRFANSTCPVEAGHFGRLLPYDGSQAQPSYPNRYVVPGAGTEPNTWRADTYHAGNRIRDVGELRLQGQVAAESGLEVNRMGMINSTYTFKAAGDACDGTRDRGAYTATMTPLVCLNGTWQAPPLPNTSSSACSMTVNKDTIRINPTTNKGEWCDGSAWRPFSAASTLPIWDLPKTQPATDGWSQYLYQHNGPGGNGQALYTRDDLVLLYHFDTNTVASPGVIQWLCRSHCFGHITGVRACLDSRSTTSPGACNGEWKTSDPALIRAIKSLYVDTYYANCGCWYSTLREQ